MKEMQLELGSVATGSYYEFQDLRKSTTNRIRNVIFRRVLGLDLREVQKKKEEDSKYLEEYNDQNIWASLQVLKKQGKVSQEDLDYIMKMKQILDETEEKEDQYHALVESFVENEDIFTVFTSKVRGLGPLMTAMLLYYFGYCEKAKHPSSLWKFAGLTPDSKYKKGESSGFNKQCRMFMWRIGDCFIKLQGKACKKAVDKRYRNIYDAEKARQKALMEAKAENAPKTLKHADMRARRKMVKFFLADYYRVSKFLRNQEQSKPYSIDKLGHAHFDDVLVWLEKKKETEKV